MRYNKFPIAICMMITTKLKKRKEILNIYLRDSQSMQNGKHFSLLFTSNLSTSNRFENFSKKPKETKQQQRQQQKVFGK